MLYKITSSFKDIFLSLKYMHGVHVMTRSMFLIKKLMILDDNNNYLHMQNTLHLQLYDVINHIDMYNVISL